MSEHRFGGGWTEIKLEVLHAYLDAYVLALKNRGFKKIYIDAFAGTGECIPKTKNAVALDGSAKIALETNGFDRYLFVEHHADRFQQLTGLCKKYPHLDIRPYNDDANKVMLEMLRQFDRKAWRGVAFLDPYGLQLDWSILLQLAATQAIDVWYLFPLSGLYRQAARKFAALDESKEAAIDRCLGTTEWRQALYRTDPQSDIFDDDPALIRQATVNDIEMFVKTRLSSIFPKVLEPLRLPKSGAPLFSLFFAIANPSPKAIEVASRIAKHILKNA